MPTSAEGCPPPPPPQPLQSAVSSSSSNNNDKYRYQSDSSYEASPSHPNWNSFMSDITMSEDEIRHHHHTTILPNKHSLGGYDQQPRSYQNFQPLQRNEGGSNASLMEYSASSEEQWALPAHGHMRDHRNKHHHSQKDHVRTASSTSFRFRDDLTLSSRVVRFPAASSDEDNSDHGPRQQLAAEEGMIHSLMHPRKAPDDPALFAKKDHPTATTSSSSHRHQNRKNKRSNHGAPGFLQKPNEWVTQLAYSFRTPPVPEKRKSAQPVEPIRDESSPKQQRGENSQQQQHPQQNDKRRTNNNKARAEVQSQLSRAAVESSEFSPLLPTMQEEDPSSTFSKQQRKHRNNHHHHHHHHHNPATHYPSNGSHAFDYVAIAAAFLQDYEAARPPTLAANVTWISHWHIRLHRFKYSQWYSWLLTLATMALFMSSALEGPHTGLLRLHWLSALNLFAISVFAVDLWIRSQLQTGYNLHTSGSSGNKFYADRLPSRPSQANLLTQPLCLFGIFLSVETVGWWLLRPDSFVVMYSSVWKPIVLYYTSPSARHAMEALARIGRIVIRVLVIEMVLILSFAAVACRLFHQFEPFDHLSIAWLSLFKLSTTVVNPSIWMEIYQENRWSALFFVLFIIVTVFYMHSLVLSVVFQTYIQAATEIHDRSVTDREDAIQLSFAALKKQQQQDTRRLQVAAMALTAGGEPVKLPSEAKPNTGIPLQLVRETLEMLRPHYSALKINALVEIFGSSNAKDVDFPTFRTKIRQALNASIRTARIPSPLAVAIELTAVVVAVTNFIYVILLTSSFSEPWFNAIEFQLGSAITIAGLAELVMRTNPLHVHNFTPMTRFNGTFDGLAMIGALISCIGIVMGIMGDEYALEFLLMGRAVDMIRVMRFFQIFRDVVRRTADVLPVLLGPITLIVTMLHVYVYVGMALWGGAVEVGGHPDSITPLYDLNNFNSYVEGMVTMFQILVVNDWHAIAEVFLSADRCSSPFLVYSFFISGNLLGVSILVNVVIAFFVESFVTKLNTGGSVSAQHDNITAKNDGRTSSRRDLSIRTSQNNPTKRITSSHSLTQLAVEEDESLEPDADSEASSGSSELFEFDVYEREGYDKIIQTVTGGQQQDDFARQVTLTLELFESLIPGREKVGYLVCCQQTINRYGNRRFEMEAEGFLDNPELHSLVSDMHAELLVLSSRDAFDDRSLVRVYPHQTDSAKQLEISASILRRHPALTLFVSRIITS